MSAAIVIWGKKYENWKRKKRKSDGKREKSKDKGESEVKRLK
jgi:hypothetical protein